MGRGDPHRDGLGLFIEAPSPVRLVLAGRLRLALPAPQAPIADIRMDLLGSLDFTAGRLEIDAVLRNSRVAAFTITGQAALRASWLTDPAFLLSIGGFHPRFTAPANFPALQRVLPGPSSLLSMLPPCAQGMTDVI